MKEVRLIKAVGSVVAIASILALNPIGASAKWRQDNNGWWYSIDNSWYQGWQYLDSNWYYFGQDGYMKTGWLQDGGNWYYLYSSGEMAHNTTIDGFILGSDGAWVKTGWRQDSNGWYYVKENGDRETGAATNGWAKIDNKFYYFGHNGYMKTGWVKVESKWYYLMPSGEKAVNTVVNGYVLDVDGAWVTTTRESDEARNLILKEDSNYINSLKAKYGRDIILEKGCKLGNSTEFLGTNTWNIPSEEVYKFSLFDSENNEKCLYLVGKTSKNIYCIPHSGYVAAYQIKDNQIIKTFEWLREDKNDITWR